MSNIRILLRPLIGLAVLLLLVYGARSLWNYAHKAEDRTGTDVAGALLTVSSKAPPVTIAAVELRDMPITIDAIGTVQSLNTTTIRTQVNGRLVRLNFKDGQDVKKGDVLAMIEPTLYQAQFDQAVAKKSQDEATLANARLDLVRYKKLTVGQYGSQQQYDTQKFLVTQLEAQIRADQAMVDSTRATLNYCTIRSPIDGRTGIRQVDLGNILHESDTGGIVVVTQLKPIYVSFTLPQQALLDIQAALAHGLTRVTALGPDNASTIDVGEVSAIDNTIDQATGTARIRAIFPNSEIHLWPGQFVNARVVVNTVHKAVVVPIAAVQQNARGSYVYLLRKDGTVTIKTVALGERNEDYVIVAKGLESGAQVVTSGFSRLSDSAQVRVLSGPERLPNKQSSSDSMPNSDGAPPPFEVGELRQSGN